MHSPEDASAWKTSDTNHFVSIFLKWPQIYEDTSLFQEHSIFPGHVFERNNRNKKKKNPHNILKEAVITTQQYNKNLLDKSISKDVICWLLCDVKGKQKPWYELQ